MTISDDSTRVIASIKVSDREYHVRMWNPDTHEQTFTEKFGGVDTYIKLKTVEKSPSGDHFAVAYMEDGKFRVRTFGKETRTQEEIQREELKINEELGINY